MRILVLSNNPGRASFRQRIGNYLPLLESRGVAVSVCRLPRSNIARWKVFSGAAEFDGVLLHKKCLNFFDACVLRRYAQRVVYDIDDAVMYSPWRPEGRWSSHLRLFRRTAGLADCVIAGNEYLAELARDFCGDVRVLATGLNTAVFEPDVPREDEKVRLVWIGSRTTLGYLKDLRDALEEVGRRHSNVVLRVIADKFIELGNMEVEKCRWSLEGQAKALAEADIGLAPLCDNRFTRGKCGFKILQYFAAGLAVVASPVGVNTDFVENSEAGMLAAGEAEWVNKLGALIEERDRRREMGQKGKEFVKAFDVSVIGTRFADIVCDHLEQ